MWNQLKTQRLYWSHPFPVRVCGWILWEKPNSHDVHSACQLSCRPCVLHNSHISNWRTSLKELFRGRSRRMLHPQSNHGCLLRYWQRPHKVTEDNRGTNFALQGTWPWHVFLPSVGSGFYRVSKINTIDNILCMEWHRVANMWNVSCMWQLPFLSLCRHRSLSSVEAKVFFAAFCNERVESLSKRENIKQNLLEFMH